MSLPVGAAINTNPASSTVGRPHFSAPIKLLAKLQAQYMQGKHCDTRILCVVVSEMKSEEREAGPSKQDQKKEKKPRRSDHADENSTLPLWPHLPKPRMTDILCHANVACSPYFEAALSGGWNEAQTKMVEVVLQNEQAVQDMKLLIKLCYFDSYVRDAGELLDRDTRIRLAFLGNAFEMHECVSGCLRSLVDDLAPVDTLTLLDELPEELRGHEAMRTVTEKVLDVLVDVLENWTESAPPTDSEEQEAKAHQCIGQSSGSDQL